MITMHINYFGLVKIATAISLTLATSCTPGPSTPEPDVSQQETPVTSAEPDIVASEPESADAQSIAAIVSSNNSFSVLASLLEEAGWVESFDGSNGKEFTVFAPTDEAFSRLPEGTLDSLYEPGNKETLYDVIAYHIIGGSVTSDQLSSGAVDSKASGLPLQVEVGQSITVNGATVSTADITATNGVIHVIDTVLIPQR